MFAVKFFVTFIFCNFISKSHKFMSQKGLTFYISAITNVAKIAIMHKFSKLTTQKIFKTSLHCWKKTNKKSVESADWICFQMFGDKWKKQPFIFTLGKSNCIVFIAASACSKSKKISYGIPGTRFEISLKNIWYVWYLFSNNGNKQGRSRPSTSAWIVYVW